MAEISVGDLFPTYSDFEDQLRRYKNAKFVDFFITDSRTLQSALKRCPNITGKIPEAVKYYYVKLQCVQGGNFKIKKGNKAMRLRTTLKQDCKAFIYLKVDEATCMLKVSKINEEHNHDISESLFRHLPSQRRLPPESEQDVYELLELKDNKEMMQEKMFQTTGKIVSLRDLFKISVTAHPSTKKLIKSSEAESATSASQSSTTGIAGSSQVGTATSASHASTKRSIKSSQARSAPSASPQQLKRPKLGEEIQTQKERPKLGEESTLKEQLKEQIIAMNQQTSATQKQTLAILQLTKTLEAAILQQTTALEKHTIAINAQTEAIKSMLNL